MKLNLSERTGLLILQQILINQKVLLYLKQMAIKIDQIKYKEENMNGNNKKDEWDESYKNKDNYMFYPHEDVIRFISKYIAFMLKDNESYVDAEYQSLKGERYKLASAYSFNKYGMKKDSSINHASEIMNEEYLLLAIKYSDFIKMPIGKSPTTLRYDKNDTAL